MNKTTYLAVAAAILLLLGGLYYFVKDESAAVPPTSQQTAQGQDNRFSFIGNSMVEEKDGKKIWEISAESIELNQETKMASIKNIKAVFYQDNGGTVELTSGQAVMNTETRDISLEGAVKASASDGATLTAEKLNYSAKDAMFYGTGGIKLLRGDTVITGDQLESDKNLEKVKVTGRALVQKKEGL